MDARRGGMLTLANDAEDPISQRDQLGVRQPHLHVVVVRFERQHAALAGAGRARRIAGCVAGSVAVRVAGRGTSRIADSRVAAGRAASPAAPPAASARSSSVELGNPI